VTGREKHILHLMASVEVSQQTGLANMSAIGLLRQTDAAAKYR
jgi:hypothetical protein